MNKRIGQLQHVFIVTANFTGICILSLCLFFINIDNAYGLNIEEPKNTENYEYKEAINNFHVNFQDSIMGNISNFQEVIRFNENEIKYMDNLSVVPFKKGEVRDNAPKIHEKVFGSNENTAKNKITSTVASSNNEEFNGLDGLYIFISTSIKEETLNHYINYLKKQAEVGEKRILMPIKFVLRNCIESSFHKDCLGLKETAKFAEKFLIQRNSKNLKAIPEVKLLIDPNLFNEHEIQVVPTFMLYDSSLKETYFSAGDGRLDLHMHYLEEVSGKKIIK